MQFSLSRVLGTAALEIRLNLGSPAPWLVGLVLAALGYLAVRVAPDASSFPLGWVLSHEIGPLSVVMLLFLAASLAYRPQRYDVTELQEGKVVASEELILGRWIGMVVAVLVPVLIQYGVTMTGQKIHATTPVLPLAYLHSFGRLLPSVLLLTTLAFFLVCLTRILVLGAGLAGLCWFAFYFGQPYYPGAFRLDLTQNRFVVLGLAAGVLFLMLLAYRGRRREKRSLRARALAAATALLFLATGLHAAWISLALPGKRSAVATWERLQEAGRKKGEPLPNFAWTDLHGRRVSFASFRGKPALVVFFQPKDTGLVPLLRRLAALRKEFPLSDVGILPVCLSEDLNGARDAARLAGADALEALPIVTDWGGPSAGAFDRRQPSSVLASTQGIGSTPAALLLDRDGKESARQLPLDEPGWPDLKARLRAAIRGIPAAPAAPAAPTGAVEGMARP